MATGDAGAEDLEDPAPGGGTEDPSTGGAKGSGTENPGGACGAEREGEPDPPCPPGVGTSCRAGETGGAGGAEDPGALVPEVDAPSVSAAAAGRSAPGLAPALAKNGKDPGSTKSRPCDIGFEPKSTESSPESACSSRGLVHREPLPKGSEELPSPKLEEGFRRVDGRSKISDLSRAPALG